MSDSWVGQLVQTERSALQKLQRPIGVTKMHSHLVRNVVSDTSWPVSIYWKGILVPLNTRPMALREGLRSWPWMPRERGVAAGIVLWRDGAGAVAESSCCVLDCQHSNEGGVKSGTRSFGWILFSSYIIYLVSLTLEMHILEALVRWWECTWVFLHQIIKSYFYCRWLLQWCCRANIIVAIFYILNILHAKHPSIMSEQWSPLQTLRHHPHQGLGSLSFPRSRSHGNFIAFQWAAWFTSQHWPLWG